MDATAIGVTETEEDEQGMHAQDILPGWSFC
jgi:hypothetical protein